MGVVLLALGVTGCSDGGSDIVYSTTTTDPSATTTIAGDAPEVPDVTLADYTRALDEAVDARDTCALMDVIDLQRPDLSDPRDVVEAYAALSRAADAAQEFVPDELAGPWAAIVEATTAASGAAHEVNGDLGEPAIEAPFAGSSFNDAYDVVTAWVDLNCG